MSITQQQLHKIQESIVTVWQVHIQQWTDGDDIATTETAPRDITNNTSATESEPMARKGHVLHPIPDGDGMFCVKCGIYTNYMKHIRLKILKNPCRFAHLPKQNWLSRPGMQTSSNNLDELEKNLHNDLNKANHHLIWNRRTGRDDNKPDLFGWIWCAKCRRLWPWCKRHANLTRSKCQVNQYSTDEPDWVKNFETRVVQPSSSLDAPRIRLRQKTNPNTIRAFPTTGETSAAVSPSFPPATSPGVDVQPRVGVG